jgi:hypothetical protein
LPTSFLIDHTGKVVLVFNGMTNWHDDEIRKKILSYMPGNPIEPRNSYNTGTLNRQPKSQKSKDLPKEGKK